MTMHSLGSNGEVHLVFTQKLDSFTENFLTGTSRVQRPYPQATTSKWRMKMMRLVILSLALGLLALPAHAQRGSVNINGNIFDAPPERGYAAPPAQGYAAPPATMGRAAAPRHVRKHHTTHSAE